MSGSGSQQSYNYDDPLYPVDTSQLPYEDDSQIRYSHVAAPLSDRVDATRTMDPTPRSTDTHRNSRYRSRRQARSHSAHDRTQKRSGESGSSDQRPPRPPDGRHHRGRRAHRRHDAISIPTRNSEALTRLHDGVFFRSLTNEGERADDEMDTQDTNSSFNFNVIDTDVHPGLSASSGVSQESPSLYYSMNGSTSYTQPPYQPHSSGQHHLPTTVSSNSRLQDQQEAEDLATDFSALNLRDNK